jgi:hypothetical protein
VRYFLTIPIRFSKDRFPFNYYLFAANTIFAQSFMSRNGRADQRTFSKSGMTRLAGIPGRQSLTETEKIDILHQHWNGLGPVAISLMMKRSDSTIRTFVKTYEKHGEMFPRRRRPAAAPSATCVVDVAIDQLESNRRLSLHDQTLTLALDDSLRMNRTLLWKPRHDCGYYFYKDIGVCCLTAPHEFAGVQLCEREIKYSRCLPTLLTDELTV